MSSRPPPIPANAAQHQHSRPAQPYANPLLLAPQEFAHDADQRLGRANGNTYQRRPALENVHDGQIMIRLKKKRFIIIDYSVVPQPHDLECVKNIPYIVVPDGAGERLCATRNCPRIGVPVQLYDSEPDEPASLYLRGGLCFSCQRTLNEKRRTQRKRKCDQASAPESQSHPSRGRRSPQNSPGPQHPHRPPPQQRYRLNGSLIDLNPDAVIINGPIEGTRTRGPDYQYPRIGQDLLHLVAEIHRGSHALLSTAYRAQSMGAAMTDGPSGGAAAVNSLFQSTFRDMSRATYLITQWKASWDENLGGSILASSQQQQQQLQQQVPQQVGVPQHHPLHAPMAAGMPREEHYLHHHPLHDPGEPEGVDPLAVGDVPSAAAALGGEEDEHEDSSGAERQRRGHHHQQQQHFIQQQQRQASAMMAPAAAAANSLQDEGDGEGEEKNNYDLSEFYEEV